RPPMGRQPTPRGCTVMPARERGDNVTVCSLSWAGRSGGRDLIRQLDFFSTQLAEPGTPNSARSHAMAQHSTSPTSVPHSRPRSEPFDPVSLAYRRKLALVGEGPGARVRDRCGTSARSTDGIS